MNGLSSCMKSSVSYCLPKDPIHRAALPWFILGGAKCLLACSFYSAGYSRASHVHQFAVALLNFYGLARVAITLKVALHLKQCQYVQRIEAHRVKDIFHGQMFLLDLFMVSFLFMVAQYVK